jgi:pimeloyl-ACP methyl ester carboxylesterase
MPEYESTIWPLGMMFKFVDVRKVLESIVGWKDDKSWRVLVIAGEKDRLMGVSLMERMAAMYRAALQTCWWGVGDTTRDVRRGDGQEGVGFSVIKGSGHHVQNDLHWEECAEQVLAFVNRL